MNRGMARKIAKSGKITWGQIRQMLTRAICDGAADTRQSKVNKSFTKGAMFNVLVKMIKDRDPESQVSNQKPGEWIAAKHCLVEFGEYWDGWTPPANVKPDRPPPMHQEAEPIEWPTD